MKTRVTRGQHVFRMFAAALPIFIAAQETRSQPYLTLYEAPGYNGTSGYVAPSFRDLPLVGVASPGKLLNEDGVATWVAGALPVNVHRTLRWEPDTSPAVELAHFDSGVPPDAQSFAINANADAVGFATSDTGAHAVKWNADGTVLTLLGDAENLVGRVAYDITDAGVAVGYAQRFSAESPFDLGNRAVRWDAAGNVLQLGTLTSMVREDGFADVKAFALNKSGIAVGNGIVWSGGSDFGTRGVRWDATGTPTELEGLGTTDGYTVSSAVAINSAGDTVGMANKYDLAGNYDGARVVRWDAATTTALELEVLGTNLDGFSDSRVNDINDAGTSVGFSLKYVGGSYNGGRAVRWDASGQATELGLLNPSNPGGMALDVNEAGIVVGFEETVAQGNRAVYWGVDGVAVDLNTLVAPSDHWRLTNAFAISDTGWILGEGQYDPDGPGDQIQYARVFMLQAPIVAELPGDYNGDGSVDAADYVLWRKNPGGTYTQEDYHTWRANFGRTAGGGSVTNATVPEPATAFVVTVGGRDKMLESHADLPRVFQYSLGMTHANKPRVFALLRQVTDNRIRPLVPDSCRERDSFQKESRKCRDDPPVSVSVMHQFC